MSSKKREEIESEVRSYVVHFPKALSFCISFGCLRMTCLGSDGKMDPGSADSIFGFFRILKASEKRATDLLKEKEVELHRVSNIRLPLLVDFLIDPFVTIRFSVMTLLL